MKHLPDILVAIPFTRNFGLLLLGPVIVNIPAFHIFIMKRSTLFDPTLIIICFIGAFPPCDARGKFLNLLNSSPHIP